MKYLIFCGLVLLSIACSRDNLKDSITGDPITVKAFYKYDLPSDGCDWHFFLYENQEPISLVENEESKTETNELKVEAGKVSGTPKVDVTLTYRLTGKKKEVMCGWLTTESMEEIDIIEVKIN